MVCRVEGQGGGVGGPEGIHGERFQLISGSRTPGHL
jgi:hypothetical protein